MKIEDTYYRKLVDGYLNKTLTKRELTIFFDLLSKGELDFYLEEDMISNFPEEPKLKRQVVLSRKTWFAAVAVLLLFIGLSGPLWFSRENMEEIYVMPKSSIKAGGNHAVLTLSDGREVVLGGDSNTELIQDNEVNIANSAAGVLKYDFSSLSLDKAYADKSEEKTNCIKTPNGGTYQIILSDGTKVWLNSRSSINFPLVFDKGERVVDIEGEVFFEVAKNERKPFIVRTKSQEIKVLGTSFNVNAYKDEPFVRTTLVTGKIKLKTADQFFFLEPGDELINYGEHSTLQTGDIDQVLAWKEGYFKFDKVDLKTLMREISRWYNVSVDIDAQLENDRFVGKIKRSEDLDKMIYILKEGGLNIRLVDRTIIVRK
ncbi:FecR family protein [Sphingobacterium yanglingense]|uniref:FecR family protein n=1 Tax=Sphingobacterium yanglingense TaxID=1437280 RepID=A0A4R6WHR8_9SPHI|nr:FecR family protein [Sphingobacterium yanglingense]TDQ79743.1 FecR family protein [Sphingobacterium yanglingense]